MRARSGNAVPARRWAGFGVKLGALALFVYLTNFGFAERVALLRGSHRWGTLLPFIGVWGLSLAAILLAAFQPKRWIRAFWAGLLAFSSSIAYVYRLASGSELTVFDALSLWGARHEVNRAAQFYQRDLLWFAVPFLGGLLVMLMPPVVRNGGLRRWMGHLAWAPAVPIVLCATIILLKDGKGSTALPVQFSPVSIVAIMGGKLATSRVVEHQPVVWNPATPAARNIVVLIDESIRADYIDWKPGNPYTPELAALKDRLINYGPAASGGNCSHTSNAILRFLGAPRTLVHTLQTSPTIWQYAKKAGYRTVYIDAQAGLNKNPGKLQNYMTLRETQDIDALYALDEKTPAAQADYRLLEIVLSNLKADQPVFIYANKNGAHFPYDSTYPEGEAIFHPTMAEARGTSMATRVNSYRNSVRWSVDRFFRRLFDAADLSRTVLIYTSDHGQAFQEGHLTHCTVENPNPQEGLVPLFVATEDQRWRAGFIEGARQSSAHGSHFSIAPTLLELMGYSEADVHRVYGVSLFERNDEEPAFTSGDVLGLFSEKVQWHQLDLTRSYREPGTRP